MPADTFFALFFSYLKYPDAAVPPYRLRRRVLFLLTKLRQSAVLREENGTKTRKIQTSYPPYGRKIIFEY